MFNNICIAFDGSENAYRAVDFAFNLAKLCSPLQLSVVSVAVPPELPDVEASVHLDAVVGTMTEDYREQLNKIAEKAKADNLAIKTQVRIGHAVEQLLQYVRENKCDIVVTGKKGKSGIEELLIGSVSKSIARYAPCTVITVK